VRAASAGPGDDHDQHDHAPVTWTLPAGWKILPAAQMRYASIQTGDDPDMVLTVIALSPNQGVLPNINRWEQQIGLPPSSEAEATAKLKQIDVEGAKLSMLNLTGPAAEGKPAQAILVAWAERPDHTWYFKLQGDVEKVADQREKFSAFAKSIKFDTHDHGTPAETAPAQQAPQAPAPGAASGLPKWAVPAGWQQQPEKPMRVATYRTSADATAAEIVISKFPQFGGMLDNINRWRNQVGLPPVTNESAFPPQKLAVGAAHADVYEFTGAGDNPQRIRVALLPTPDGQLTWFFKLQGPADVVAAQHAAFDQFVQSVRF
jgi:hypothetical protein